MENKIENRIRIKSIKRPSFLAQIINGLLLTIALIMFFCNFGEFELKDKIIIIILLGIGAGVHGIMHHFMEIFHGYNILE